MSKNTFSKLIVSSSLLILLAGVSLAKPAETPKGNLGVGNSNPDKVSAANEPKPLKFCQHLQDRIELRAGQFEKTKQGHLVAYKNAAKRLEKFINKYKALGYDTTKLSADLTQLNTLIATFDKDHAAYVVTLRTSKLHACLDTPTKYDEQMTAVKNALAVLRKDITVINDLFKNSIKPHLMEIRNQIAKDTGETEEEE